MEAKFDSTNNEQRSAYRMIERTNNSFFLAAAQAPVRPLS